MKKLKSCFLVLVMLISLLGVRDTAYARPEPKPEIKNLKISTKVLRNNTVLVKLTNNNDKTVTVDVKLTFKKKKDAIGTGKTTFFGVGAGTTSYTAVPYTALDFKDGAMPTSVDTKPVIATNCFKGQIKDISKILTTKFKNKGTNELWGYDSLKVKFNNIAKKDVYGTVVVGYYNHDKLVAAQNCYLEIDKGKSYVEMLYPFIFISENINIDEVKLMQNDLRYR